VGSSSDGGLGIGGSPEPGEKNCRGCAEGKTWITVEGGEARPGEAWPAGDVGYTAEGAKLGPALPARGMLWVMGGESPGFSEQPEGVQTVGHGALTGPQRCASIRGLHAVNE
jgi:hypothetical protein